MVKVIPLPLVTHMNAAEVIQRIAQDSSRVIFKQHSGDQMKERGISQRQILNCLQRGTETDYQFDNQHMNHKVNFSLRTAGVYVTVVAALIEKDNGWVAVVTTWSN